MNAIQKYNQLDLSKIPAEYKQFIDEIYTQTKGFTISQTVAPTYYENFNTIYDALASKGDKYLKTTKAPAKKTVAKVVVSKTPAAKKPVAKKTVAKKPVAKKTVAKKAVTKKPVAKKRVVKKPVNTAAKALARKKIVLKKLNDDIKAIESKLRANSAIKQKVAVLVRDHARKLGLGTSSIDRQIAMKKEKLSLYKRFLADDKRKLKTVLRASENNRYASLGKIPAKKKTTVKKKATAKKAPAKKAPAKKGFFGKFFG